MEQVLTESADSLGQAFEVLTSMDDHNELFFEAVETYGLHIQKIRETAIASNLNALAYVCDFVEQNLLEWVSYPLAERLTVRTHFEAWPALILEYLLSPVDGTNALIEHLQQNQWPVPLDAETAHQLHAQLLFSDNPPPLEEWPQEREDDEEIPEDNSAEATTATTAPIPTPPAIELGNKEILEILQAEILEVNAEILEAREKLIHSDNQETIDNYIELTARLATASEMVGLTGLQEVCQFIINNVQQLADKTATQRQAVDGVLAPWPHKVLAYLQAPSDHVIALLNHLREPQWPTPLPDAQAHELLNALTQSSAEDSAENEAVVRETTANPEDMVLKIPEDVNQDLLEAFLQEAPQHANELTISIQNIIKSPNKEELKRAQRMAHTLKGSSNIIGIKAIAHLAHHLEDILEYLGEKEVVPPKPLTDTLMEAADTLEIMVDALLGQDDPPANGVAVLQAVLDWANRIDQGANISVAVVPKRSEVETPVAQQAQIQPAAVKAEASPEHLLRVPTRSIDELLRLVGEMSIAVGQIQEKLNNAIKSTKSLSSQDMLMQQKSYDLETLVDVRDISGHKNVKKAESDNNSEVANDDNFDALEFEQYNELHSCTHSFIETIADSREITHTILEDLLSLDGMFVHQERLNKEFQQIVMSTRLVPVKGIITRLERIVRQTCRATGKKAEFDMVGGDNLIDGDVLNKLTDPLLHILRNAIDHGLETPKEREKLGKSATGHITVRVYRQGNNIIMRCEDDGRGLNYENIKALALERGLIQAHQEVSQLDLARLIFIAGFSTKNSVTQVSGRGVGMDVVHSNILALKGMVEIESETGHGTTVVLSLPMSLVTVHVLLVKVKDSVFALPTHYLSQALTADSGEFRAVGSQINFHMGNQVYPIRTLSSLLKLPEDKPVSENEKRPLVLVHEEGHTTAVLVDALLDSRDLVAKSMGSYVKNVKGVSGASILGDGSVVPLLDLPELLRSRPAPILSSHQFKPSDTAAESGLNIPHILIVDDSLSVRKSLSQLVEDNGYVALLAKDGLEAIEVMAKQKPDILLVDMEMPRMNGIELTAHIRANEATKSIPLFMITSRTTAKHRELAKNAGVSEYLTKPYQEAELLSLIENALA